MTIRCFVDFFTERLSPLGWYDAREVKAMAQRLLEEVAGVASYKIIVEPQLELELFAEERLKEYTAQLATGRPLQYVLGYEVFCNHKFAVSEGVLIPRPETEELVRLVIDDIKRNGQFRVLDICTGSGCIAWSVAAAITGIGEAVSDCCNEREGMGCVLGCDISEQALQIAVNQKIYGKNGELLSGGSCLVPHFFRCDILDGAAYEVIADSTERWCNYNAHYGITDDNSDELFKFNIVISNPPYVCEEERGHMRANVLDFEPESALFVPDDDPLLFYRRIAELSGRLLQRGGRLYFEANERFAEQTAQMLTQMGFVHSGVVCDLFGKKRFVIAILP